MADLRYSASVDVKPAQQALESLKSSVAQVTGAIAGAFAFKEIAATASQFENLRTSLQILYRDAALGGKAFEEIKEFAATSAFSVEDLTQTVIKLKAAGLEPTVSLLQLFADTSAVAADSVGALQAITDLYARTTAGGLGLEDLNRLADRGIPVFDILQKKLGLSRLEVSKIGQSAEGAQVILQALEAGLQETFGGASEARAKNLSQAFSNFGDSVANAADTLGQSGLNEGLGNLIRSITELIENNKALIESIGKGLGAAFQFLADNLKTVTVAAGAFFAVMAVGKIVQIIKAFSLLNAVIGKNPLVRLAMTAAAVAGTLFSLSEATDDTAEKADELNKTTEETVIKQGKLASTTENFKGKLSGLNDGLRKFREELSQTATEFARVNQQTIDSINLETRLIGTTKEFQEVERARAELVKNSADQIARLELAKSKLTKEEQKEGRAGVIDAQIAKIKEITAADLERTQAAVQASEARQMLRKVEEFSIQNAMNMENELQTIRDESIKMGMSEIEKKYYDIEAAAKRSAKAQIDAERVRIGRPLSEAEQKAFYDEAIRGTQELKRATEEQYDASRRFETGWSSAFRQFSDEATNAAKQAERIFQQTTQGMEEMIMNFAKTGKFEFRGFLNSVLEDLLRSQVRQLMAQVFNISGTRGSGSSGGGSVLSGIGRLLGFANGGIIPTNAPVLVGERGPELISGAAGRNVTPNSQLSGLGTTNVNYNISAVDALSFKQLVASDPSFLYAVTEQGRRSVPLGRR